MRASSGKISLQTALIRAYHFQVEKYQENSRHQWLDHIANTHAAIGVARRRQTILHEFLPESYRLRQQRH